LQFKDKSAKTNVKFYNLPQKIAVGKAYLSLPKTTQVILKEKIIKYFRKNGKTLITIRLRRVLKEKSK
jgi:hypothetical protein